MKVYELMRLLGTCSAGAEVRVVRSVTAEEPDAFVRQPENAIISGNVVDLDEQKLGEYSRVVELYLDDME